MSIVEIVPEFTVGHAEYLTACMNRVSRSFVFVVACLEEPLNHHLATAYLICRVADNIEDSERSADWRKARFAELSLLLKDPALAPRILSGWDHEAWPGLTLDERKLMGVEHGLGLWEIYTRFPENTRSMIERWVSAMVEGMKHLEDSEHPPEWVRHNGVQVLRDEVDYDRYCYFVAGTVGYMATELVVDFYRLPGGVADRLLDTCEACGRGLQKTNIVKDFPKDLARGISYLPDRWMREVDGSPLALGGAPSQWKHMVLDNVIGELRASVDYVLALPHSAAGYRMASLLCLFPAYQTLLLAAQHHEKLFTSDHRVKISRETLAQCMLDAQSMVADNHAIFQYSRNIESAVNVAFNGKG